MARPRGVRNPDFEEKRFRLIEDLADFVLATDLKRASLRQFAQAASVSEPTLRHYFDDRTGVVRAIMKRIAERTASYLETADEREDGYPASLQDCVDQTLSGLTTGPLARAHAFGIIEGVADLELGHTYLATLLEPLLKRIEAHFEAHNASDAEGPVDTRAAAFMLAGPLLVAGLHQYILGGDTVRPLDLNTAFAQWGEALATAYPEAKG